MAHCDICGIKALDTEEFTEEQFPLRPAKKYCPACHARLQQRVQSAIFFGTLLFVALAIAAAIRGGTPVLQSRLVLFSALLLLQYVLIIPHELGHAVIARWFGFSDIRILIGMGKPLFHFRLFGFDWLINRVPSGGLTYARPRPMAFLRAKWTFLASGGLMVNGFLLILAWLLLPSEMFTDGRPTPPDFALLEVFFWANLIVILENVAPYTIQTAFGPLGTDGKQLIDLIFSWNKPPPEDDRLPGWRLGFARILKCLLVAFLGLCTLLLAAFAAAFIFVDNLRGELPLRIFLSAFFLLLAGILAFYTRRFYLRPLAIKSPAYRGPDFSGQFAHIARKYPSEVPGNLLARVGNQLFRNDHLQAATECERALLKYPDDLMLLMLLSTALAAEKKFDRAEAAWDRVLARTASEDHSTRAELYTHKLVLAVLQRDADRFAAGIETLLALPIPDGLKVSRLDQLASAALYSNIRNCLSTAELCIRKALDLAPGSLTLQGTLGSLLVEQGQFDQAEEFLRACYDRSPNRHDQGISGFYLALVAEHRGDLPKAKTLAVPSLMLYSEPWLKSKGDALLARLGRGDA